MFNSRKKLPWLANATPDEREVFYIEYGTIMRKCRREMGISLSDLSNRLGIKEKTLAEYESGKPVHFIEAVAIFQYLGMRQKVLLNVYGK